MEILLTRTKFTEHSTTGSLCVDGVYECHTIEDVDRGLDQSMSIEEINKHKMFGVTCIPYGRYEVIVTKSERFSQMAGHDVYLPLLLNVPGFGGIRIHKGNKPEDTEGCLLPVTTLGNDFGSDSTHAWENLNDKINNALKKGEKVYITIKK